MLHFDIVTIFLVVLIHYALAENDPFDIFGKSPVKDDVPTASDSLTTFINISNASTMLINDVEHHRELHKILVRILWHHLQIVEPASLEGDTVRVHLTALLKPRDIQTIKKYCSQNQSITKHISPDSINSLFSGAIQSATVERSSLFNWNSLPLTQPMLVFAFIPIFVTLILLVLKLFSWRRIRLLSAFIVAVVIVMQFIMRKYNQQLAKKMSLLSKHEDGPPEECKPRHLQSWSHRISNLFSFRPTFDSCTTYYEQVITDPLHGTDLYEVFLELVLQPLVSASSTIGTCIGIIYHQLSAFMPAPLALISLFFLCSVPPLLLLRFYFLLLSSSHKIDNSKQINKPSKRREKKRIKCNSMPTLTYPEK